MKCPYCVEDWENTKDVFELNTLKIEIGYEKPYVIYMDIIRTDPKLRTNTPNDAFLTKKGVKVISNKQPESTIDILVDCSKDYNSYLIGIGVSRISTQYNEPEYARAAYKILKDSLVEFGEAFMKTNKHVWPK